MDIVAVVSPLQTTAEDVRKPLDQSSKITLPTQLAQVYHKIVAEQVASGWLRVDWCLAKGLQLMI